jgi:hypothetical protein
MAAIEKVPLVLTEPVGMLFGGRLRFHRIGLLRAFSAPAA